VIYLVLTFGETPLIVTFEPKGKSKEIHLTIKMIEYKTLYWLNRTIVIPDWYAIAYYWAISSRIPWVWSWMVSLHVWQFPLNTKLTVKHHIERIMTAKNLNFIPEPYLNYFKNYNDSKVF